MNFRILSYHILFFKEILISENGPNQAIELKQGDAHVSEACAPARQQNPTNTKTCKLPTDIVQAREEQTLLGQITFL